MKFQLMQSVATSTQKLSNRSSDVILVKTAFVGERSVVGLIQSLDRDTLTNEPTAVKMNTTKRQQLNITKKSGMTPLGHREDHRTTLVLGQLSLSSFQGR